MRETPAGTAAANNTQCALTSTSETIQQKWLESANKSVRDMMNEALSACGRRRERGRESETATLHHIVIITNQLMSVYFPVERGLNLIQRKESERPSGQWQFYNGKASLKKFKV